jgi:PKD repeat protein
VIHQGPTACFDPPQGCRGRLPTEFDDSSTEGDDGITSWWWSFGDGSTSSDQFATHTYPQAGTYTVALSITASDGQTSTASAQVIVSPADRTS